MAPKFSFLFIFATLFVIYFSMESNGLIIRREAPASDTSKSVDEALESFKTGLNDLVKNIQTNELFQNVSTTLKQFSESVQQQSKQLVDKLSSDTTTKTN